MSNPAATRISLACESCLSEADADVRMCNKCPRVHGHEAKGFWAWAKGKPCECACSGTDVQIVQEREDRYVGNDALGHPNLIPEYKTYAYCTKCKHKFRV